MTFDYPMKRDEFGSDREFERYRARIRIATFNLALTQLAIEATHAGLKMRELARSLSEQLGDTIEEWGP